MTGEGDHGRRAVIKALAAELDERAAAVIDVDRHAAAQTVEYVVAGRLVAIADEGDMSFRVGAQVAQAAAGTSDAAVSPRGRDWVRFAPRELDQFTLDRAAAWFDLAVRLGTKDRPA